VDFSIFSCFIVKFQVSMLKKISYHKVLGVRAREFQVVCPVTFRGAQNSGRRFEFEVREPLLCLFFYVIDDGRNGVEG
jgi:hypothetical protein